MVTLHCACGERLQTSEENAGKRGRCPKCKRPFQVPSRTAPDHPTATEAPPKVAVANPQRSGVFLRHWWIWGAAGATFLVLVLVAALLIDWVAKGPRTAPQAQVFVPPAPVGPAAPPEGAAGLAPGQPAAVSREPEDPLGERWVQGHGEPPFIGAASPDGRWVVTVGVRMELAKQFAEPGKENAGLSYCEPMVRVWDTSQPSRHGGIAYPKEIACLNLGEKAVTPALALSPDGQRLLVAGADGRLRYWDVRQRRELAAWAGPKGHVRRLAISPQLDRAAAISDDQALTIWDLDARKELHREAVTAPVEQVYFASNDRLVLYGNKVDLSLRLFTPRNPPQGGLEIWETNRPRRIFQTKWGEIRQAQLSRDGDRLAVAGGKSLAIFQVPEGKVIHQGELAHPVARLQFSPTGSDLLVLAVESQFIPRQRSDLEQKAELLGTFGMLPLARALVGGDGRTESNFHPCAFASADGAAAPAARATQLAQDAFGDGKGGYWLPPLGNEGFSPEYVRLWPALPAGVHAESLTGVTGGTDGRIRLWDLRTGKQRGVRSGHGDGVACVAISPDGLKVASGSFDGTLRLWDLGDADRVRECDHAGHPVIAVAFSPDGSRVLSGCSDHTLRLWDVDGKLLHSFQGHKGAVCAAIFSPDGRRGYSSGLDRSLLAWDLDKQQPDREFPGLKGGAVRLTVSPDGRWLAVRSLDGSLRVWDSATGKGGARIKTEAPRWMDMAFLDANRLVVLDWAQAEQQPPGPPGPTKLVETAWIIDPESGTSQRASLLPVADFGTPQIIAEKRDGVQPGPSSPSQLSIWNLLFKTDQGGQLVVCRLPNLVRSTTDDLLWYQREDPEYVRYRLGAAVSRVAARPLP